MPQANSFAVNDRAGTPVSHTFVPRTVQDDVAAFAETNSAPIGERKFTVSWRKSGSNYKVRLVFANPTLVTETINGVSVPSVQKTAYADLTLTFSELSTLQERKDTVGMFANAMAAGNAVLNPVLTELEGVW